MKPITLLLGMGIAIGVAAAAAFAPKFVHVDESREAAQTSLETLPAGYRDWKLVSVAREEGTLDDIRAVLGNDIAIKAYREGKAFPDGAVIARLAWSLDPSEANNQAFGKRQSFVAGHPKNGVQFMLKDSKKYASTGGWTFAQFDDGKPVGPEMLKSCFPCHDVPQARDRVFTHYSP